MVKDIIKDEKILSTPCEKATADDAPLVQDLIDTIGALEDIACLAANQIGQTKAVVVYLDQDDQPKVMFNPVLKQALHPVKTEEECFSLDGVSKVTRYGWIKVSYDELREGELVPRQGTYEGWEAQAIQHMIDHCKGKLV